MAEPEDIFFQLAITRHDEFNGDRRSVVENIGLLLALAGILMGFVATIWFGGTHKFWMWMTMVIPLDSIGICLYLCLAQKYQIIDTVRWWYDLSSDPTVVDNKIFQQRAIASLDDLNKANTEKIKKIWGYLQCICCHACMFSFYVISFLLLIWSFWRRIFAPGSCRNLPGSADHERMELEGAEGRLMATSSTLLYRHCSCFNISRPDYFNRECRISLTRAVEENIELAAAEEGAYGVLGPPIPHRCRFFSHIDSGQNA